MPAGPLSSPAASSTVRPAWSAHDVPLGHSSELPWDPCGFLASMPATVLPCRPMSVRRPSEVRQLCSACRQLSCVAVRGPSEVRQLCSGNCAALSVRGGCWPNSGIYFLGSLGSPRSFLGSPLGSPGCCLGSLGSLTCAREALDIP